jgi:hypothetical protein
MIWLHLLRGYKISLSQICQAFFPGSSRAPHIICIIGSALPVNAYPWLEFHTIIMCVLIYGVIHPHMKKELLIHRESCNVRNVFPGIITCVPSFLKVKYPSVIPFRLHSVFVQSIFFRYGKHIFCPMLLSQFQEGIGCNDIGFRVIIKGQCVPQLQQRGIPIKGKSFLQPVPKVIGPHFHPNIISFIFNDLSIIHLVGLHAGLSQEILEPSIKIIALFPVRTLVIYGFFRP